MCVCASVHKHIGKDWSRIGIELEQIGTEHRQDWSRIDRIGGRTRTGLEQIGSSTLFTIGTRLGGCLGFSLTFFIIYQKN